MSFYVPQFFRETYTRNRYLAGSYLDGVWISGVLEASTSDISGSLQPIREREIQYLPEGRRNKESIVIYTANELRTEDEGAGLPPDIVTARGKDFQVARVWYHTTPWTHYKAICFLVDGQ